MGQDTSGRITMSSSKTTCEPLIGPPSRVRDFSFFSFYFRNWDRMNGFAAEAVLTARVWASRFAERNRAASAGSHPQPHLETKRVVVL